MYKQFDVCQLITTKSIRFLSGPPGAKISPHGDWIIAGNLPGGKLVLCKDNAVVVALITDVRKVADHNMKHMLDAAKFDNIMKELQNVEEGKE